MTLVRLRVAFLVGGALLLALAIAAAAGAGPRNVDRGTKNGGTLTVALAEDPDALDPSLARTFVGRIVFLHICEKLYDLDAHARIVPQLAAALPKVSRDKLTVTIRLRKGIRFNDGTAFNAQAVKASLDRHRTLKGSTRASELSPVASVDAVGSSTIVIHLTEPYAPLTAQLADRAGMVLSPAQVDKLGDKFASNPVCVGPFQYVDRVAGDHITVKKSPFYYAKNKVHVDRIVFRIINDPAAAAQALKAGDVQVVDRLGPTEIQGVARTPGLHILKAVTLGYQGITLNIGNKNGLGKLPYSTVSNALAQHPQLRRAFELSLDRNVINKVALGGTVRPGCTPISASSAWFDASIKCPKRNVAVARRLIRQAGVSTPVPVKLMIGTSSTELRIGQVIQSQANEAGFNVTLQPTEFVTSLRKADNGDYETFRIGWSGRVDPDGNIYQFVATKGSQNDSGYSNPRLDLVLNNARKAATPRARRTLYHAALKIIQADRPLIYLWYPINRYGVTNRVSGVRIYPDGLIRAQFAAFK